MMQTTEIVSSEASPYPWNPDYIQGVSVSRRRMQSSDAPRETDCGVHTIRLEEVADRGKPTSNRSRCDAVTGVGHLPTRGHAVNVRAFLSSFFAVVLC